MIRGDGPRPAAIARRAVLAGLGSAVVVAAPAVRASAAATVDGAADTWLASLTEDQRRRAVISFESEERRNWHYTPRRRRGLPLADMSDRQKQAAFALLRAGLSATGVRKAEQIIVVEDVLGRIETFGFNRDPDLYFLTVFGRPAPSGTWGWRFEGHHLSINMAYRDGRLIAATPLFLGANPAVVPIPPHRGLEVMGNEIRAARALLAELGGEARNSAIIAGRAFGDIVTGPGREESLRTPEGLPAAAMTAEQRDRLITLVELYARLLPAGDAATELSRVRDAGWDSLHFAWAGSTDPGGPHYFRVHGPVLLIEYDNSRNDANHVHSVWHDPANAFGLDVLGAHYRTGHAHPHA